MTVCKQQLSFSFYRHQPIHADFLGGQITSDAGLLPLRAFDQHHGLTRDLAQLLCETCVSAALHHSPAGDDEAFDVVRHFFFGKGGGCVLP